jgi:hypothetical protein
MTNHVYTLGDSPRDFDEMLAMLDGHLTYPPQA